MLREIAVSSILMVFAFAHPLEAKPRILAPRETFPGGVVTLLIWDTGPLAQVKAELRIEGKTVASGEGFSLGNLLGEDRNNQGLFLPLPSTQKPGEGLIHIRHGYSDVWEEERLSIHIRSREFVSEEIPLDSDLTKLRREPEAEKTRQSQELYALLTRVDWESVYLDTPFIVPLRVLRTSSFYGDRRIYRYSDGTRARSIHTGIDYVAELGTAINAAGRGRVVLSENRIITGETVVIEHLPGVYSLYYHLQTRFAEVGALVEQGEIIGTLGATGFALGAHLHWEIRVNGIPVAPAPLIKAPLIDKRLLNRKIEG